MKKAKPIKKAVAVKKTSSSTGASPSLGSIVLVHTKSSTYGFALLQPKIVSIDDLKFLEGIQVTGKENHRMEKKRTLLPFDHVASIVEFESEEALWKQSQPRVTTTSEDGAESQPVRVAPERPHRKHEHRRHDRKHRSRNSHNEIRHEPRIDNDAHLQAKYDASLHRKFTR